jgi:hypothetical protein
VVERRGGVRCGRCRAMSISEKLVLVPVHDLVYCFSPNKYISKHSRLYIDMYRKIDPPVLVLGYYRLLLPLILIFSA